MALPPVGTNFVVAGTPLAVAIMSSFVTPKAAQYLGMRLIMHITVMPPLLAAVNYTPFGWQCTLL